jgi:hypothetical protein
MCSKLCLFHTIERLKRSELCLLKNLKRSKRSKPWLIPQIRKIEEKKKLDQSKANRIRLKPVKIEKPMGVYLKSTVEAQHPEV